MLDTYWKLAEAHGSLLDRHSETLAELSLDWQHDMVENETSNRETARLFETFLRTLTKTTGAFLEFLQEHGTYPLTEGNFRRHWQTICVDASTSPARNYAIVLCQALIEVAYITGCVDSDEEHFWVGVLQRVRENGEAHVVEEAFNRILAYEHVDEGLPVIGAGDDEEYYAKYYQNLIEIHGFNPLNTHHDYPDRVENLREQVIG